MTFKKIITTVLFSGLLVLGMQEISYGQSTISKKQPKLVVDPILGRTSNVESVPIYQKKKYYTGNYENLSRLYWAVGMHSLTDNKAIDGFLRINECDLYKKYFSDDFKWEEIREATKKLIAKERNTFPTTFEILLPLSIGEYDIRREVFEIREDTSFKNMKKIDIALGTSNQICGSFTRVRGYPESVIMILDQPFNFVEVPVKPEIANLFIHEATVVNKKQLKFERDAYLRVLVSFSSYVNTTSGAGGSVLAVMHAKIDAIEVYADSQRTKPLYIKDFAEVRRRHRNRVADESLVDEVEKAFTFLATSDPEEDNFYQLQK